MKKRREMKKTKQKQIIDVSRRCQIGKNIQRREVNAAFQL